MANPVTSEYFIIDGTTKRKQSPEIPTIPIVGIKKCKLSLETPTHLKMLPIEELQTKLQDSHNDMVILLTNAWMIIGAIRDAQPEAENKVLKQQLKDANDKLAKLKEFVKE